MRRVFLHGKSEFYHNGLPVSGGTANFYQSGTSQTTTKSVYSDYQLTTSLGSTVTLDEQGRASIFLGSGFYDVVVKDSNGVELYTEVYLTDDINIDAANVVGGNWVCNGSFEDGTGTDADEWVETSSDGTVERVNTDQGDGEYCMKFTSTGTGGGYVHSCIFPVTELQTYNLSWLTKSDDAGVRNVMEVEWFDKDQVQLGGGSASTTVEDDSTTNPLTWTLKEYSVTPVSGAYWAKVKYTGCHSSDATAGSTWLDRVEFVYRAGGGNSLDVVQIDSTSYSLLTTNNHTIHTADTSSLAGEVTVTLPTVASAGAGFHTWIYNEDGDYDVIVKDNGGTTLARLTGITEGMVSALFVTDGTDWYVPSFTRDNQRYSGTVEEASGTALSNSSFTQLDLDSATYDPNGDADTANDRVIPSKAGKYLFIGSAKAGSFTAAEFQVSMYKNGTALVSAMQLDLKPSAPTAEAGCMAIVDMNGSTDDITLHAFVEESGITTSKNMLQWYRLM